MTRRSPMQWLGVLPWLGLLVALVLPAFATGYWIRLVTNFFMMATMATALNLITGYTGYPALGNAVFFGLGAYTVGTLMTAYHLPFLVTLPLAGLVCAAYAALIGAPILRIKGHYFLMATIGVMEATREIINNLHITGGEKGLFLPVTELSPEQLNNYFYYIMLTVLVLALVTVWALMRSRFGFAVRAVKASEDGAAVLGINTTGYKVTAWAISALFTGLAGGVYAYWATFIEPRAVFDVLMAVKVFVMLLLGGPGLLYGPLVGALLLEIVGDLIWGAFPDWQLGILGAVLIAVILLAPRGVSEFVLARVRRAGLPVPQKKAGGEGSAGGSLESA